MALKHGLTAKSENNARGHGGGDSVVGGKETKTKTDENGRLVAAWAYKGTKTLGSVFFQMLWVYVRLALLDDEKEGKRESERLLLFCPACHDISFSLLIYISDLS